MSVNIHRAQGRLERRGAQVVLLGELLDERGTVVHAREIPMDAKRFEAERRKGGQGWVVYSLLCAANDAWDEAEDKFRKADVSAKNRELLEALRQPQSPADHREAEEIDDDDDDAECQGQRKAA